MGREIRRVVPNWSHPQEERYDTFRWVTETDYVPMFDHSAEEAWADWQTEYAKWLAGEHDRIIAKYGEADYPKDEPYRAFCAWHGRPPEPKHYRPAWPEGSATWFQMYETVSEGTPVTPPFATKEELVEYLVANGDFWDQKRRAEELRTGTKCSMACGPWDRAAAERFVNAGWAPSMMVTNTPGGGAVITTPRDGM